MIGAAILLCLAPVQIDGDTLKCGATRTSIRLFGINSPEKGTAGASEATAALGGLIAGGLVCQPRGTSYSRIVAVCFNAAGVDIGKAQIEAGHAIEWCSYSRNFYGTCAP